MTDQITHEEARECAKSFPNGTRLQRLLAYIGQQEADTVSRAEHEAALASERLRSDRIVEHEVGVRLKHGAELLDLETNLTALQQEHESAKSLLQSQAERIDELVYHLRKQQQGHASHVQQVIDGLQASYHEERAELQQEHERVTETLRASRDELRRKCEAAEAQLTALQQEHEHALSDVRSLLNARGDLEGQRDALKARVAELEAELRIAWEDEPSPEAGRVQTSPFPQVARATAFRYETINENVLADDFARAFACCGSNGETPPQHCADCPEHPGCPGCGNAVCECNAPPQPERTTAWVPTVGDSVEIIDFSEQHNSHGEVVAVGREYHSVMCTDGRVRRYSLSEITPTGAAPPQPPHVAIPALPIDAEDERVVDEMMPKREARPLAPECPHGIGLCTDSCPSKQPAPPQTPWMPKVGDRVVVVDWGDDHGKTGTVQEAWSEDGSCWVRLYGKVPRYHASDLAPESPQPEQEPDRDRPVMLSELVRNWAVNRSPHPMHEARNGDFQSLVTVVSELVEIFDQLAIAKAELEQRRRR